MREGLVDSVNSVNLYRKRFQESLELSCHSTSMSSKKNNRIRKNDMLMVRD